MLADVAKLHCRRRGHRLLHGEVPLLILRRLNGLVPDIHHSARERVCWRSSAWTLLSCVAWRLVGSGNFSRGEGRITRETQVRACAFQVGRDRVRAANDHLVL